MTGRLYNTYPGDYKVSFSAKPCPATITLTPLRIDMPFTMSACADLDDDGHFAISNFCPQGNDCNDHDPAVNPGAPEICDGKDNNCNNEVDEGTDPCCNNPCCEDPCCEQGGGPVGAPSGSTGH